MNRKIIFATLVALPLALLFAWKKHTENFPRESTLESKTPSKTFEGKLVDSEVEKLLIQSTTVDEFLEKLSHNERTKSYLDRFIPIWESDSLQKSYSFCPRILMYNSDASFVMSIVGCPRLNAEQDDVEIVQWNETEQKFELYSVHFRLNSEPVSKVQIGEKNPAECIRCHRGGIAIGAFDSYNWAKDDLTYNAFNFARLYGNAATKQLGNTVVYNDNFEVEKRMSGIKRYRHFNIKAVLQQFPLVNMDEYERFKAQVLEKDNFRLGGFRFLDSPINKDFTMATPVREFNLLLSKKNHQRTIQMAKEIFGEHYNKYKYFLLAALSDCTNFHKFYPDNPNFPDPETSRETYEQLKNIYSRVGLEVLRPRIESSKSFFKDIYTIKQLDAVGKVYYGFLSMNQVSEFASSGKDMDQAVRDLNLNPIKFTMYSSWGIANIVEALLDSEPDFDGLKYVGKMPTAAYLRMLSGLPPKTNNPVWQRYLKAEQIINGGYRSVIHDPAVQQKLADVINELYYEDPQFKAYCEKIESSYHAQGFE